MIELLQYVIWKLHLLRMLTVLLELDSLFDSDLESGDRLHNQQCNDIEYLLWTRQIHQFRWLFEVVLKGLNYFNFPSKHWIYRAMIMAPNPRFFHSVRPQNQVMSVYLEGISFMQYVAYRQIYFDGSRAWISLFLLLENYM